MADEEPHVDSSIPGAKAFGRWHPGFQKQVPDFDRPETQEALQKMIAAMGATPLLIEPSQTPAATTARHTERMSYTLEELYEAMARSVDLAEQTRQDNIEAQVYTRRMSVVSLWVSIGSFAAAVASIAVAIIALASGS